MFCGIMEVPEFLVIRDKIHIFLINIQFSTHVFMLVLLLMFCSGRHVGQ